ncbi:MAG: HEAT repeat domain-containing protein [Chitinivibrionales bacterium]
MSVKSVVAFTTLILILKSMSYGFLSGDIRDLKRADNAEDSIMALVEIGDYAERKKRAQKVLISCLSSKNPDIRRKAVEILGNIEEKDSKVIKEIMAMMEDSDPSVRRAAVAATQYHNSFYSAFIRGLKRRICDKDELVREMTASTLIELERYAFRPLKQILEEEPCEKGVIEALRVIKEIGRCPSSLYKKVEKYSDSKNRLIREEAEYILREYKK